MSEMFYEGTADYLAATPALIVSYIASGSISAGRLVEWTASGIGTVNVPAGIATGSVVPIAGLSLATVANGEPCPVLVMGYFKNGTKCSTTVINPGMVLAPSGAGYFAGYTTPMVGITSVIGRAVSGSGTTYVTGYINVMK